MKKQKLFCLKITMCIVAVVVISAIAFLQNSSSAPNELIVKEHTFASMDSMAEVPLEGERVVGVFEALNTDEQGVYLLSANQTGQIQVSYYSFTDSEQRGVLVYSSEYTNQSYDVYMLDDGILLLELYYNEAQDLAFCLSRIGYADRYDDITLMYQDTCERMPYVAIAELATNPRIDYKSSQVLLNYDKAGISKLLLLSKYPNLGDEHTMINNGIYGRYEEGTIETGRKITFVGGYGDCIYYQALSAFAGDPPPEVRTFEAIGTPVLFRYNISTEEITRVAEMDKIALHVNGSRDYAIVSEYDYYEPLFDSGKVILLGKDQAEYVIPGVESGADICESKFIAEDKVVFYNPTTLYFAELGKGILHTYPLDGNDLVLLKGDGAYIVVHSDDEQAVIKYIVYDEIVKFEE